MDTAHEDVSVVPQVRLTRVELSVGSLDLIRFVGFDHAFPPHAHEHYTVGAFEMNGGSLRYRGATWRASYGAVLAVPPDEVHAAFPGPTSGWTYRALYPSTDLVGLAVEGRRTPTRVPRFAQPLLDDPALAHTILALHRRLTSRAIDLELEESLLAMLRTLVERHAVDWRREQPAQPTHGSIARAREFLHANFAVRVPLAHLAHVCGVSPFHLVRTFREVYGLPPHAYLTQVRASRAREMLVRGESVGAAAAACGFCDRSHLTRVFRNIYGVTPGAYVRELHAGSRRRLTV